MSADGDTPVLLDRLAALNDLLRIRLLRLLEREELGVGELAAALQVPQSTVSRHLKRLHEGGWVARRTVGTASRYQLLPARMESDLQSLWSVARSQVGSLPAFENDTQRAREIVASRPVDATSFFGRLGGEWDALRCELFGTRFADESLPCLLATGMIVADLGCGTGNAAIRLAPIVGRLIAVDREAAMLKAARKRLADFDNVEFLQGDLLSLPIDDGAVDAAIVFLVLHHLEAPVDAVREVRRILKPGGVALLVDMLAHDRHEYRDTMGHRHLGFAEDDVASWARASSLELVRFLRLRPDLEASGPPLFAATLMHHE